LIRYSRACGSYNDFFDEGLLLNQVFLVVRLKSSLRKFYGRYHDFVNRSGISVSEMTTYNVSTSRSFPHSWLSPGL